MGHPHMSGVDVLTPHEPLPTMREILGDETAQIVANACRTTGIKLQAMKDRRSAFFLYKIARLFE